MPTKILIIDDHPIIVEGYKNTLLEIREELDPVMDIAVNCDDAYEKIISSQDQPYHLILLDISLPPSKDGKILSGEDLGLIIREKAPSSHLIVLTMFNENYRLHNILKNLNPEGFLIKSDVTPKELLKAIEEVSTNKHYYSHTVIELLRKQVTSDILIDNIDRKILFHLSKGVQTRNLIDVVPLSLAAVEKRKRLMKEAFGIRNGGDILLLETAKQMGFL